MLLSPLFLSQSCASFRKPRNACKPGIAEPYGQAETIAASFCRAQLMKYVSFDGHVLQRHQYLEGNLTRLVFAMKCLSFGIATEFNMHEQSDFA
eukprot:scaffold336190_cov18-Prasinocladus_malaysianus.AAC.1